jgi:hypothetical protein
MEEKVKSRKQEMTNEEEIDQEVFKYVCGLINSSCNMLNKLSLTGPHLCLAL